MEFSNSRLERILGWSFVVLTIYVGFYLTLTHYASEAYLLALLVTHLGIYTSFRKIFQARIYAILILVHLSISYWIGRNALEILSAIDGWKQGF